MSAADDERRTHGRARTDLRARWEGVLESREGTLVDLGVGGCFILTNGAVQSGELLRLDILLPSGRSLLLWGEVVYVMEEMGFALSFTGASEDEQRKLEALMEAAGPAPSAPVDSEAETAGSRQE